MSPPPADTLEAIAHAALVLPTSGPIHDLTLWRRATRLTQLVARLAREPEMADVRHDRRAAEAAALFFEVARARAVLDGTLDRADLLTAELDEGRREASVDALAVAPEPLLPTAARDAAIAAIRAYNRPTNAPAEAVLLTEAVHLDDLGSLWLWHEARRGECPVAALEGLLKQWRRRQDYGYWDARIREGLRFEFSRRLARRRVAAMQVFVESLAEQTG